MVKVEITLKDEQGKQISQLESIDVELGSYRLNEIEIAGEKLKREMLPELSKHLLEKGQREFTEEKKKTLP